MWSNESQAADNDAEEDARKDNALEEDPNPMRHAAGWIEGIGPEGMSRDEVMEELEASGFDVLEDDAFDASPKFPSDMPNWSDSVDFRQLTPLEAELDGENANLSNERPVEDQAIRELEADGDEPEA